MQGDEVMYHAVLVLTDERVFDPEEMRRDVESAYRATGQWPPGPAASDDPQAVVGRDVCTRIDVFAPAAAGGTVPEAEIEEGLDVFRDAYPDLPRPAGLVSVQVFSHTGRDADAATLSAVLAQVVDLLLFRLDADFVRLPGRTGLMTGARFRAEFRLASAGPRRANAAAASEAPGAEAPRGDCFFPDIDMVEDRLDREWRAQRHPSGQAGAGGSGAEGAAPGSELVPVEARLATWAINASVAVFAPPVGASLAVYNLLRGEDFRLNAHAMALTGLFLALAASGAPLPGPSLLL